MSRYAVGLGSNLGDRLDHLVAAVEELRVIGEVTAVSSLYETEPVGGPEQSPFLNAVVVVESDLDPLATLGRLQEIEQEHGRERMTRWGPRTLDLDLVTSDTGPLSLDRLTLPHPRAAERGFVLRPLNDVWPDAPVGTELTAARALASVGRVGVDHLARVWAPTTKTWPGRLLVLAQLVLLIGAALALVSDGRLPNGGVTVLGVIGAALAMGGVIAALIASRTLGPAMTVNPVPREGARLVVVGPYRYVRHPIYGSITLVILGTAMFLDSLRGAVAAAVLAVFFWFKASYEERQLRMKFADYREYMTVVRRRLVPFLL